MKIDKTLSPSVDHDAILSNKTYIQKLHNYYLPLQNLIRTGS